MDYGFSRYSANVPLREEIVFKEKALAGSRHIATLWTFNRVGEKLYPKDHPLLQVELKGRIFSVKKHDANSVSITLPEGFFNFYVTGDPLENREWIIYGVKEHITETGDDFTLYQPGIEQNLGDIRVSGNVNVTTGHGRVSHVVSEDGDICISMTSSTRPSKKATVANPTSQQFNFSNEMPASNSPPPRPGFDFDVFFAEQERVAKQKAKELIQRVKEKTREQSTQPGIIGTFKRTIKKDGGDDVSISTRGGNRPPDISPINGVRTLILGDRQIAIKDIKEGEYNIIRDAHGQLRLEPKGI